MKRHTQPVTAGELVLLLEKGVISTAEARNAVAWLLGPGAPIVFKSPKTDDTPSQP